MIEKSQTFEEMQEELIRTAQRGYTFPLAGAFFMVIAAILSLVLPMEKLRFVWLFGMGSIFPLALLLGKMLGLSVMSKNPLAIMGGLVGGIQGLFLPVWIFAFLKVPEYLPFFIGVLGGAHFLPYAYIYRSKAYIFLAVGTVAVSALFGAAMAGSHAYTYTPIAIASVYFVTVIWLIRENGAYR